MVARSLVVALVVGLCALAWPGGAAHAQDTFGMSTEPGCNPELGDLSLTVDAYGSFGTSTFTHTDAMYDPPAPEWPRKGTVFESMPFLCETRGGRTSGVYLEAGQGAGDGLRLGNANILSEQPNEVTSEFDAGDLHVVLTQSLNCTVLTQCYMVTNNGAATASVVAITQYIDGDLQYVGGFTNDYGSTIGGPPRTIYEFDQGDDPLSPSTYLGLSSTDPRDPFLTSWELGQFSESRTRIANVDNGCQVLLNGLVNSAHVSTDADGDLVTDRGYDVTLSLRFDVGPLEPGSTTPRPVCIDIRWGVGLPCGDPDEDGICQQDDNCDFVFNPGQEDVDGDAVGDVCDNCPTEPNEDQDDRDGDAIGDACDKHYCVPTPDTTEVCDGADNDCDGRVDNVPEVGGICSTGLVGACAQGAVRCLGAELICVPSDDNARLEICDLIDNDCDGAVDEDLSYNECGTCGPSPLELCDGEDNDCDGEIDEDVECPEEEQVCLYGACRDPCESFACGEDFTLICSEEGYCVYRCDMLDCQPPEICSPYGDGGHCEDACASVPCQAPDVCVLGSCGSCFRVGCPGEQVCVAGQCIADPCATAECAEDEACIAGECRPSCAAISCELYHDCVDGECRPAPCGGISCPDGMGCDDDGQCVADPCDGVVCEHGQTCQRGTCFGDPCHQMRCPPLQRCVAVCGVETCEAACVADWLPQGPTIDPCEDGGCEGEGEGEGAEGEGEGAEGEGEGAEGEGEGAEGEGEGAEGEGEGEGEGDGTGGTDDSGRDEGCGSCRTASTKTTGAAGGLVVLALGLVALRRRSR